MTQRYLTPSSIVLMLVREFNGKNKVLLQRRSNTGFADGLLDLSCSGHVEKGECMTKTVVRECKEELGISLNIKNVRFMCFVHKRDGDIVYYNGYFMCDDFDGEPQVMERDKCSQLVWADYDNLPADLIPDRMEAVKAYKKGIPYIEYGWDKD
jgi:ADP-ribose pyrophosphatase YjhB (NUDIX family)